MNVNNLSTEQIKDLIFNAIMESNKEVIHLLDKSNIDFTIYRSTIINALKGNQNSYLLNYFIKRKIDISPYKKALLILSIKQDNASFAKVLLKNSNDTDLLRQLYNDYFSSYPSPRIVQLLERLEKKYLYQRLKKDTQKEEHTKNGKHKI